MIRIDTNYIINYLMNDNIKVADIAEEILTTKNVFIANQLLELIKYDNLLVSNYSVINKAKIKILILILLNFVDCILCSYLKQDEIITFDKKLNKYI